MKNITARGTANYDKEAKNPRLQCPRCGKWKRLYDREHHELFVNVEPETHDGFETICRTCIADY